MVFLLGFLVSGLLTLLFLPAFWRRASRLSARRLETQMPLSMAEIVAERDQLRAVFATEQRQLEQRLEALADRRAADLASLGRRETEIVALQGELSETRADLARVEAALAARDGELAAAGAEIGALHQTNHELDGRAGNAAAALANLADEHVRLEAVADERRIMIAGLETRLSGMEMSLDDLRRRLAAATHEISERDLALARLGEERDFLRLEATSAAARRDHSQAASAELTERIAELERINRTERREKARLETEVTSGARALADASAHLASVEAHHARQLAEPARRAAGLQQEIENLRAEKAALEGALDFTRRELLARGGGSRAAATAPDHGDAAALRRSIAEVGADIQRLVAALREDARGPRGDATPQSAAERVRDLQARAKRAAPTH